jgi:hypothetical protein
MKISRKFKSYPAILMFTAGASGLPAQVPGAPPDQKTPPAAEAPGTAPAGAVETPPAPPAGAEALPVPDRGSPTPYSGGFLQNPPVTPGVDETLRGLGARRPAGAPSLMSTEEMGPWTAAQATGAPNTPTMGDIATAWAAAMPDNGEEWLSLQFTLEADLDRVRVVQSFNPGAITKVTAEGSDGRKVELEAKKPLPGAEVPANEPVVAEFVLPTGISLRATSILITIDEHKVPGWNEIDAVEMVGRNGARQWAQTAKASSSFGDLRRGLNLPRTGLDAVPAIRTAGLEYGLESGPQPLNLSIAGLEYRLQRAKQPLADYGNTHPGSDTAMLKGLPWSPEQATGAPDTPVAGDYPTAWAPLKPDGGKEWLDVTFAKPADVREVRIFESSGTKAITGVQVYMNGVPVPLALIKEDPPLPGSADAAGSPVPKQPVPLPEDGVEQPVAPGPRIVTAAPEKIALPAVQKVRIELECTGRWAEIDAVELIGTDGSRQWAARAEASSTYATLQARPLSTSRGYQRANTLEEANQRIDLLTRRLEQLEREVKHKRNAPPAGATPGGAPPPGTAPGGR